MFVFRSPLRSGDDPGSPPSVSPPITAPVDSTLPAPPPAAKIVVTGGKSEEEVRLSGELAVANQRAETESARAKRVEQEAAELHEENHRLRKAQLAPPRKPKSSSWVPSMFND